MRCPEKRKVPRKKVLFTVEIAEKFLILELSGEGMKILSDFRLPPGLEVPFRLHLKDESVPLIAESIWCRRVVEGVKKQYEVGFSFVNISSRTQKIIESYIY